MQESRAHRECVQALEVWKRAGEAEQEPLEDSVCLEEGGKPLGAPVIWETGSWKTPLSLQSGLLEGGEVGGWVRRLKGGGKR